MSLAGIDVIASTVIPQHRVILNTNRCRSPSRALRRYKQRGIMGRIGVELVPDHTVWMIGNKAIMSPFTLDALKKVMDELPPAPMDPFRFGGYEPKMPEPAPLSPWLTYSPFLTPRSLVKPITST